jgi:hypothetical protein
MGRWLLDQVAEDDEQDACTLQRVDVALAAGRG